MPNHYLKSETAYLFGPVNSTNLFLKISAKIQTGAKSAAVVIGESLKTNTFRFRKNISKLKLPKIFNLEIDSLNGYTYRMRTIITRGLYIINSLFEGQKCSFKGLFS